MATKTIQAHKFKMVVTGGHMFEFYTDGFHQNGEFLMFEPSLEAGVVISSRVRVSDIVFLLASDEAMEIEVPEDSGSSAMMDISDFNFQNEVPNEAE